MSIKELKTPYPVKRKSVKSKKTDNRMSLSKYVATCGVTSRRGSTEIIKNGEVMVNGVSIREPGYKLNPDDKVQVQGQLIREPERVYILLNKPKDYIASLTDERGRKTVMELIDIDITERLFPIGRLDRSTTGLIILTNDGDFAQKLSHPRYEIPKIYHVTLDKPISAPIVKKIGNEGVDLEDGHVNVDAIYYLNAQDKNQVIVEIHSGKNRVVRRIFEAVELHVKKLDRVGYASLTKQGLRVGQWRHLSQSEVNFMKHSNNKKITRSE
jgi:23S rRNA pseudouridine2605 synthase